MIRLKLLNALEIKGKRSSPTGRGGRPVKDRRGSTLAGLLLINRKPGIQCCGAIFIGALRLRAAWNHAAIFRLSTVSISNSAAIRHFPANFSFQRANRRCAAE